MAKRAEGPRNEQGMFLPGYSEDLAVKICELIADGMNMSKIAQLEGMPHRRTMIKWRAEHREFDEMYEAARQERAAVRFDELQEFVNSPEAKLNVPWARLKFDEYRWTLARMDPKRFGDKVTQEVTGKDGKELQFPAIMVSFVKPDDTGEVS